MVTIAAWAIGWCVGAMVFAVAFAVLAVQRTEWMVALLVLPASLAAFGFPTYIAARRNASRRPIVQALIWTIGAAAAGMVLSHHYVAETALASPGDLNINTTETIRARQASFERWGVAPEVVDSYVFSLEIIIAGCFGSALGSTLVAAAWEVKRLIHGMLFGLASAIAVVAGVALLPIGTYMFAMILLVGTPPVLHARVLPTAFALTTMVAGSLAGTIIEYTRPAPSRRQGY